MSEPLLKQLVEQIISQSLKEQEPEMASDDSGLDLDLEPEGEASGDIDLDADSADMDLDIDSEEGFEDAGFDTGGAGGGLNVSSGGGFGGADTDFGEMDTEETDSEAPPEHPSMDGLQPGESFMPEDPVQAILDNAVGLLSQTSESNVILNSIKSDLQRYFIDDKQATPIIQRLWHTEDPVLRVVARKLLLFIRGN